MSNAQPRRIQLHDATIHLGGDTFTIAPLNLGQLEQAIPILNAMANPGADTVGEQLTQLVDVLQIAVSERYPDLNVRKLNVDLPGLQAAFGTVIELAGFPAPTKIRAKKG